MPGPVSESEWSDFLDEKQLTAARRKAETKYRDLTSEQIARLRRRAKTDLFFLVNGILEYDLLSERLHGNLCRWIRQTWGEQYRMVLLPRNHFKSTVFTVGDATQMALPNDANVQAYPYSLGPNIKLLIAHEKREMAARFLFDIGMGFRRKLLMLALFPECIPSPRVQRINKWELELPREQEHKEPTFDTIGTGGAAQGNHYNWLKLDDIIGEAARDSPTVMSGAINWFDNVNSLLTRPKLDGWDMPGTRWADEDTYNRAIEVYGVNKKISVLRNYDDDEIEQMPDGVLAVYGRSMEERGLPIFPEENSIEFINRMRKNPIVYAAQYANNPRRSGLTEFDDVWLRFYNVNGPWIYVFAGENSWKVNVWDLDRVVLMDPSPGERASGDHAGIVVTGTDKKLNVYILETVKAQFLPPAFIDEMFRLYTKWQPRLMSVEEVNFSNIYRHWYGEKCKALGIHPNVRPFKPSTRKTKDSRIRGLTNYFSAGQIILAEGMHDFRNEYEKFPLNKRNKHLLDALAQGPEVWTPGLRQSDMDHAVKGEKMVMQERDAETGY